MGLTGDIGGAGNSGDAATKDGGRVWTGSFETAAADMGKGRDVGGWDMTWGDNRAWRAAGPSIRAVTGGSEAGVATGGGKAGDELNALGWQGIGTGIGARACWGVAIAQPSCWG